MKCPKCDGQGWTSEAGHNCDGSERSCARNCPVEVQVQCEFCEGTGFLPEISN